MRALPQEGDVKGSTECLPTSGNALIQGFNQCKDPVTKFKWIRWFTQNGRYFENRRTLGQVTKF
jgi:hypothetical protein